MGYLSQKKHQIRENLFLNVTSVALTFFTILSLSGIDFFFPNLFHLYVFSFLMFVYSLLVRKFKTSLIFVMLFIINYTALSSSGNIFLSESYDGKEKIELVFDKQTEISGSFSEKNATFGSLILAGNCTASYVKIEEKLPMTIIKVDLRNIKNKTRQKIFKQLHNFITKQDNPVIVYGEFGVPSWNKHMKKFMMQSRIFAKNRILFTQKSSYNFFNAPSFYVLGFRDLGIDNINISDNKKEKTIKFDITFNPTSL